MFDRGRVKLLRETKRFNIESILIKPSQTLSTYVACTQIAGIGLNARWKPQTPRESYPTPATITDDQATSIEVLKGLSTRDLLISDSEPDCEIVKPSSRLPTREENMIPSKTKPKISTSKGANEYKRHPLGVRERLKNGRWKCAHKCRGNCHHLCCKEGLAKPPRIRAEKQPSSPISRNSQRDPALTQPRKETPSPFNPNDIINMTRFIEDCEKPPQGHSLQTESKNATRRTKPVRPKKPSGVDHGSHHSDLPSLTNLKELRSPEREEKLPRKSDSFKESSQIRDKIQHAGPNPSMHSSDSRSHEIGKGKNFFEKVGENILESKELNNASGIEKFRNKIEVVNDFDEKEIFRQRKDIASCEPLELPETIDEPNSSSSSQLQIAPTESYNQDRANSKNPEDEIETDELDEDWDIKIFEGYLSRDSEAVDEAHTPSPSAKRNINQVEGREQSTSPKKPRVDLTREGNFSIQPNTRDKGILVDSLTLENPSIAKCPTQGSDSRTSRNCNSDVEDEPDPLMKMADEVMAWAELHVAQD